MHKYLYAVLIITFLNVAQAQSMDFSWIKPPNGYGHILMSGEVKAGDYQRFVSFMQKHVNEYGKGRNSERYIHISSQGGNLVESLQIAGLLRQMYPTVHVENAKCASSCLFLYLSGAQRYVYSGSIGIHRAYFDRTYFAGLDAEAARVQQTKLTSLIDTILEENGVPQSLREKMSNTPSSDIYWLSQQEISSLGEYPAWYEELLIAKCDLEKYRRWPKKSGSDDFNPELAARVLLYLNPCKEEIVAPEIKKLPALLAAEEKKLREKNITGVSTKGEWKSWGKYKGEPVYYYHPFTHESNLVKVWIKKGRMRGLLAFDCSQRKIKQLQVLDNGEVVGSWDDFYFIAPGTFGEWLNKKVCR